MFWYESTSKKNPDIFLCFRKSCRIVHKIHLSYCQSDITCLFYCVSLSRKKPHISIKHIQSNHNSVKYFQIIRLSQVSAMVMCGSAVGGWCMEMDALINTEHQTPVLGCYIKWAIGLSLSLSLSVAASWVWIRMWSKWSQDCWASWIAVSFVSKSVSPFLHFEYHA